MLTATVVATTWVAFGVFVGHHAALGFHDGSRNDVLGGDEFDLIALTAKLCAHGCMDLRIAGFEFFDKEARIAHVSCHGDISFGHMNGPLRCHILRGQRSKVPKRRDLMRTRRSLFPIDALRFATDLGTNT